MDCPACDAAAVRLPVPEGMAAHAPADTVAVCRDCLHVAAADAGGSARDTDRDPDPGRVSDALPTDVGAAVGLLLAVDLLDSLATNRAAIEALLSAVERRGTDPVLAFERLADDPDVDPSVDIRRRTRQLEGLRS